MEKERGIFKLKGIFKQHSAFRIVGSLCLILTQIVMMSSMAFAMDAPPPRPPLSPAAGPVAPAVAPSNDPGAHIELYLLPMPSIDVWTVVQWADGAGNWHDVESWRKQYTGNPMRWWVDDHDFDTGPFRWVLYHPNSGKHLGASKPFFLPKDYYQVKRVFMRERSR